MTAPPATGELRLRAALRGPRTVLTEVFRTAPFHPGPAHERDGAAEVILQEVSPGIFPGERLDARIAVGDGARLIVRGQGATKLYPASAGRAAALRTRLAVTGQGALWWLPGALIPFRDADFSATTGVALDATSRFAALEIITPGRMAMGERFAYRRLDLRIRIDVAGRPRLIERTLLEPGVRTASMLGVQGPFGCVGTLVLIGYPLPPLAHDAAGDLWLGGDGGPELAIVRGLANEAEPLAAALLAILHAAAEAVGDDLHVAHVDAQSL